VLRLGLPAFGTRFFKLEELFRQFHVDLAFWAHEHSYERLWPTYNNTVFNGTSHPGEPYRNPGATVHVITGAAGCREGESKFDRGPRGAWSAVRNSEWGYGRLRVVNNSAIGWEQVEDANGTVVDSFVLVKDPAVSLENEKVSEERDLDLQAEIFSRTEQCQDNLKRLPGCARD
jgi:hypothetical protein